MRLRVVLLMACVAGCELVAPLEDVRPDGVDAAAGSGGSGGSGGTGGSGGSAGNAGIAGTAGSAGATPELLASAQSGPENPVLDATHVYWTNSDSVARVAKAGGSVEVLVTIGVQNEAIAVDASNVYFTDRAAAVVYRAPKTGGSATPLAENQSFPQGIAIDGQYVYWASEGDGAIRRVLKTGGTVEDLATNQPFATAIAVDSPDVFWTLTTGEVRKLTTTSCCAVTELSPSEGTNAFSLQVDATHVYWASHDSSGVRRVLRTGGSSQEIGSILQAEGMALDETFVYVGQDAASGSILRQPKDGSSGGSLVTGQDHPRGVAVDATHVYWTNTDEGSVYRVLK